MSSPCYYHHYCCLLSFTIFFFIIGSIPSGGRIVVAGFSFIIRPTPSLRQQPRHHHHERRQRLRAATAEEEEVEYVLSSCIDDTTTTTTTTKSAIMKEETMEPYCWHPIDYSAANEFIQEHYHHVFPHDYYFENGAGCDPFDENNHDGNKPIEPVYNARDGILIMNNNTTTRQPAKLDRDGFTLIHAPSSVTDYTDLQQIKETYIPELRRIIRNDLLSLLQEEEEGGGDDVDVVDDVDDIDHILFWNPVYRGENQTVTNTERNMDLPTPPTSPTAGMVHIDTDIGAYDTQQLINLIQKNQIISTTGGGDDDDTDDDVDFNELIDKIEKGKRYSIINFWRNADTKNPIQRQPLAVLSPCYNDNSNNSNSCCYFPISKPDPTNSLWYTYPEMTSDEVLVFKQYDRDGSYPSDVWHFALKSIVPTNAPCRISFDIRAFVVYKSNVIPIKNDRYSQNRIRPILTFEESGAFCNQQAQKRALHTTTASSSSSS